VNSSDYGFWTLLWLDNDTVGRTVFLVLMLMSLMTWYLVVIKGVAAIWLRQQTRLFLQMFWRASSLDSVCQQIQDQGLHSPFAQLAAKAHKAQHHHRQHGVSSLAQSGSAADFLTRSLRRALDEQTARLEAGLTVLATIGATAPFVGLLGTVWGIYHAMMMLAMDEAANFASLAGPVGEALVMTALGLIVAIPAVLAYNALIRLNRVYLAKLDGFAHDLFALVMTGQAIDRSSSAQADEMRGTDWRLSHGVW
jgi:biopolymer transport protein ExbB